MLKSHNYAGMKNYHNKIHLKLGLSWWQKHARRPLSMGQNFSCALEAMAEVVDFQLWWDKLLWNILKEMLHIQVRNQKNRHSFLASLSMLVEDYQLDGIDYNWEYPGYRFHSDYVPD